MVCAIINYIQKKRTDIGPTSITAHHGLYILPDWSD